VQLSVVALAGLLAASGATKLESAPDNGATFTQETLNERLELAGGDEKAAAQGGCILALAHLIALYMYMR
jgi:hypothetical protein